MPPLAQQRLGTPDTDTGGWRHRKLWLVFLPFLKRLLESSRSGAQAVTQRCPRLRQDLASEAGNSPK